jgi:RecA/RadA recombinase
MDKDKKKEIKKGIAAFMKQQKLSENSGVRIGFMSEDETIGKIERVKTGIIPLDLATGGIYKGLINVWYGPSDSGKSTCVRDATATIQEHENWVCSYLNQEKTMDRAYWAAGGVNLDDLVAAEFETNEQALDFANQVADGRIPLDMMTVDTVQALASQGELYKKDKLKSVADNTIALIPRVYSQFLRTYTSLSNRRLTLLLISQVRTQGIGSVYVFDSMTGGNAIKHYTVVILRIEKAGQSNFPDPAKLNGRLPPNSFPVRFKVDKIKAMGRYPGTQVMGYFYHGRFDYKFNTVYIGKDIGIHDGKSFSYPKGDETIDLKYRGVNEMFNKIPDEAVTYMNSLLEPAYLAKISTEEVFQDITLIEEPEEETQA